MKIEFDTAYRGKLPEEICTLLWTDIQSALSARYGTTPDQSISERVRQEWLAMEQSDTVLDVAALYELTIWLKAMILPESEYRLSTGYEELDRILAGIDRSDVILSGARPGVGKTRLTEDCTPEYFGEYMVHYKLTAARKRSILLRTAMHLAVQ